MSSTPKLTGWLRKGELLVGVVSCSNAPLERMTCVSDSERRGMPGRAGFDDGDDDDDVVVPPMGSTPSWMVCMSNGLNAELDERDRER